MTRILLLRQLFEPLLGRTRSRGRCSAAIRLSHRPEPSGHAIHGEVGGLDMREQHCRQFVLLRHTQVAEEAISHLYKQERKRPTPVRRRLGRTHRLFLEWSFRGGWVPVSGMKMRSLVALFAHYAFHWWSQRNWWDVVLREQMGVSIWDAVHLHSMDGWALSGADVQAPWHGVLETVWLHCDEARQVGCLRWLEGCPLVWDAGIQSQLARRRWWGVDKAIMSNAAPDRRAVLCGWMDQG